MKISMLGFLVAGLLATPSVWAGSTLAADATAPGNQASLFVPGATVPLVFQATGAAGQTLTVTIEDAEGTTVDTQMVAVGADPWTGTVPGYNKRLGFYRAYGQLTDGTTIAPVGSRAQADGSPSFVTYAIVPDPAKRPATITDDQAFFGLSQMRNFGVGTDILAYLGVRWVKNADWSWAQIESQPGMRNTFGPTPSVDSIVSGSTNGSSPWVVLSLPNLTVNGRPYSGSPDVCLPNTFSYNTCALDPTYDSDWQTFVTWVAKTWPTVYPTRTRKYYELTWEPIPPWGYGGTPAEFVQLYQLAYPAMKAADPDALVMGPTMFIEGPSGDADDVLAAGLGPYLDVFSTHPYMESDTGWYGAQWGPGWGYMDPERSGVPSRLATMKRKVTAAAGRELPMVGTEQGYQTHQAVAYEIEQARRLIRSNLILLGEGWKMNIAFLFADYDAGTDSQWKDTTHDYWDYGFFYNLDPSAWGGFAPGKVSPKPIAAAYSAMTSLLEARKAVTNVNWLADTTRGYVYESYNDPNDEVMALWDFGDSPVTVTIDTAVPSVDVYDWMGNAQTRTTQGGLLTLTLGSEPTYVKGVAASLWGSGRASQNVALHKTVTTSGDASATQAGSLAVDGDPWANESRWVSTTDTNAKWLEVDLGDDYSIGEIRFFTGQYDPTTNSNFYNRPLPSYRLQRWTGSAWEDIIARSSNTRAAVNEVFTPVSTAKVRLYVDADGGAPSDVRLFEIEVLQASPPMTTPPDGGTAETPDGGPAEMPDAGGPQPVHSGSSGCHCRIAEAGAASGGGHALAALALVVALRLGRRSRSRARGRPVYPDLEATWRGASSVATSCTTRSPRGAWPPCTSGASSARPASRARWP